MSQVYKTTQAKIYNYISCYICRLTLSTIYLILLSSMYQILTVYVVVNEENCTKSCIGHTKLIVKLVRDILNLYNIFEF